MDEERQVSRVVEQLELRLKADDLPQQYAALSQLLDRARAFAGSAGTTVQIDQDDPRHLFLLIRWESDEALSLYRASAQTPVGKRETKLIEELEDLPTVVTQWFVNEAL